MAEEVKTQEMRKTRRKGQKALAKIEIRKQKVSELLGQGLDVREIAVALGVSVPTINDDIAELADFIQNKVEAKNRAVAQLIAIKELAVKEAGREWARDRQLNRSAKQSIKLMTDTTESLEKTLARLNLVPPEPRRIDVSGQMDTRHEVVNIIIDGYQLDPEEEQRE